ncbi:MAG TPA: hypothetical protein PLW48_02680 [Alphaproteobacteria bacterium]|nr:hypothetical protein [Alphaproteobacteria bacterium]
MMMLLWIGTVNFVMSAFICAFLMYAAFLMVGNGTFAGKQVSNETGWGILIGFFYAPALAFVHSIVTTAGIAFKRTTIGYFALYALIPFLIAPIAAGFLFGTAFSVAYIALFSTPFTVAHYFSLRKVFPDYFQMQPQFVHRSDSGEQ